MLLLKWLINYYDYDYDEDDDDEICGQFLWVLFTAEPMKIQNLLEVESCNL